MRIAFVCDWLTGMRGGEKCLKAMCDVYPDADIFTLVYYPHNFNGEFERHRVITSFIQKLPGNARTFRRYLPLFPKAIESFDFTGYDLILSFSHCVAKCSKVPSGTPHICYCHTPMRYAWDMRQDYLDRINPIRRRGVEFILNRLKKWDVQTVERVNSFVANSRHVQERIRRCYGRESKVIYPPVDIDRFKANTGNDVYYLVFSAFVPYKRIDMAIHAFNNCGRRLIVTGNGPEYRRLKSIANSNVEFILNPDDQTVDHLYAGCKALIFPGQEDFGIIPVEAQASGKPVIAYGCGGALETVCGISSENSAPTGVFFRQQTVDDLLAAVDHFEQNETLFTPENCRKNAERFSRSRFVSQMIEWIQNIMAESDKFE